MNELPPIPPRSAHPMALARLNLEPLAESHATELFSELADASLYTFTGGKPPVSEEALARTYAFRAKQLSPDGQQLWLNWVIRERETGVAIGYVQATVEVEQTLIAWVIGMHWQTQGFATEAARGLVAWLVSFDFPTIRARIHPEHRASQRVAERAGLTPSGESFDGEDVWTRG